MYQIILCVTSFGKKWTESTDRATDKLFATMACAYMVMFPSIPKLCHILYGLNLTVAWSNVDFFGRLAVKGLS